MEDSRSLLGIPKKPIYMKVGWRTDFTIGTSETTLVPNVFNDAESPSAALRVGFRCPEGMLDPATGNLRVPEEGLYFVSIHATISARIELSLFFRDIETGVNLLRCNQQPEVDHEVNGFVYLYPGKRYQFIGAAGSAVNIIGSNDAVRACSYLSLLHFVGID